MNDDAQQLIYRSSANFFFRVMFLGAGNPSPVTTFAGFETPKQKHQHRNPHKSNCVKKNLREKEFLSS
jgi:hypothetical protein